MLSRDSGRALLSHMWSAVTGRTLTIDVSQPTVVDRIQRLQRLETVIYTMDKIVSGAKENPVLPNFLAGDRLLMLVHGEVVAGIDFANLKPGDVKVDGKQIRLRLPPPQIFSTRIDSGKTRVYSRQTGLLVSTDPDLETQVRQERNVSCKRPPWPTAFCETPSRTQLQRSRVCCRAWDSRRSSSTNCMARVACCSPVILNKRKRIACTVTAFSFFSRAKARTVIRARWSTGVRCCKPSDWKCLYRNRSQEPADPHSRSVWRG
jgi:hypothetical protein